MSFPVIQQANQFLAECENLEQGVYWCRKFVSGSLQTQERVVIINENGKLTNSEIIGFENGIKVFPNPAKNYFILSYNLSDTEKVLNITDITGKIIFTKQIENNFGELFIKTNDFKKGIYFIQIGENSKKIIIE